MAKISQTPGILHLTAYRGDDFSIDVEFEDFDLTGHVIEAIIHTATGDEVPMTITETDYALGQFTISLSVETSLEFETGWNTWCLQITTPAPGGLKRTYLAGTFRMGGCTEDLP